MNIENDYFRSMIVYSHEIMKHCTDDSDAAVKSISVVIDFLLKDSSRISKMSADTLQAIQCLDKVIGDLGQQGSAKNIKKVIEALSGLVKEHRSVNDVIMPVVEALQFQDAIRQQMENIGKVMDLWLVMRQEIGSDPTDDQLNNIGEKMLKLTTMISERDIIRTHISGLTPEAKVDDVMMF